MKKLGQFLLDVLLIGFLTLVSLVLVFVVVSNRDVDGTSEVFGYQLRIVTSDSMGECEFTDVSGYEIKSIPVKSLIVVKTIPDDIDPDEWYRSLKEGDVLTFRYVYGNPITITHRVASITEKEDGFVIELAGDNVNAKDNQLYQTIDTSIPNNPNYVVGKVVWNAKWAGQLLSSLRTPIGLVFLIWIPCVIIIIMQVYDIGSTAELRDRKRAIRRVRRVYVPAMQERDDAQFIRYVDLQYEKISGRLWRRYARQYRLRKLLAKMPRLPIGKGKTRFNWNAYVEQHQNQGVQERIPKLNSGKGDASSARKWKKYAQQYQDAPVRIPKLNSGKGDASSAREWKKYAQQYQDAPARIPKLNSGKGDASSAREFKQYAKHSQNQERAVPMPRFK